MVEQMLQETGAAPRGAEVKQATGALRFSALLLTGSSVVWADRGSLPAGIIDGDSFVAPPGDACLSSRFVLVPGTCAVDVIAGGC